jgi:hypothetical protein
MAVVVERRDSVPPNYISFRDSLAALIARADVINLQRQTMPDDETLAFGIDYDFLQKTLISAARDGVLVPWAWNRKENRFLRLSAEIFELLFSDLHFAGSTLFFLALPDRERYLETWMGLFEEVQFERWLTGWYPESNSTQATMSAALNKAGGRPRKRDAITEKLIALYPSGDFPTVKIILQALKAENPPIEVSVATVQRARQDAKNPSALKTSKRF